MTGIKRVSVLALALLMACTSIFAQGTKETTKATNGQTEITVLNYIDMSEPNSANEIKLLWDKFAADNPDIKVIREDLFNEPFHQKTEAYVASGNLPDVLYMWPSGRSTSLHTTHSVKDLMPFLEKDGLVDSYNPACLVPQFAGFLGELPNGITMTHMLYVNKKVLADNGFAIPTSYEEMKAMVKPLKAKGIDLIAMDNMDAWVMQSCLFSMVVGRFGGVDWYKDLAAGKISFTDPWFVKSLSLIDDMYKSGMINPNSLTSPYGSSRGNFALGKAAFYIDGDWSTASFQTDITTGKALLSPEVQGSDIELMVIPTIPGEVIHNSNSGVVGTGWGMSANIPAGSAEEAASWRLIKFLEGEYAQTYRLSVGAAFPSNLNVNVAKVVKDNNLEPLVAKRAAYYNTYTTVTPVIDGVLAGDVYNVINTGLQEIGLGSKTPATVAKDVQKAWETWKANQ
ncbi:extracellular solute-binding protein [uncultured Sphaerochaeta sp.]|uniref:ABC transporter substrate-binding protein n=1 Tax=uncultured Sphaerochaeta sp. TaxID=886478 RepID=UPI002A0A3FBD|nr:extracellular solute-binding protein [uncultured Sphaerochaeta sp.]